MNATTVWVEPVRQQISPFSMIAATSHKILIMNDLVIDKATNTVTYSNKAYSVQNDRKHLHIVVRINGDRKKLTVKHKPEYLYNVFFHYYLSGLSETHRCLVQDWWMEMIYQKKYVPFKVFYAATSRNKN